MDAEPRNLEEAQLHHLAGRLDKAKEIYASILREDSQNAVALHRMGLALYQSGEIEHGIEHLRHSLDLAPDATAYYDLGIALHEQGRFNDAEAAFQRAIELSPRFFAALHNLGNLLLERGRYDDAIACYERATAIEPNLAPSQYNLALVRLLKGQFALGWSGYHWRWRTGQLRPRAFRLPAWKGESLSGKTILLHTEQGLGDTFQFIRYASLVQDRGAIVVVECESPLVPLLGTCSGIDRLIAAGEEAPPVDFHSPLLSLPGVFQTRLDTIPAKVPSLFADPSLVEHWRDVLKEVRGFRIGVNWRGGRSQGVFRGRDFPLEQLVEVARIPGVRLINLHKGAGRQELLEMAQRLQVFDPGEEIDKTHGAFMDTAAIMKNLDLIITSDTSIAHLAGALAVPVWVALPFVPDWRWLLDRSDSPWYPTMRLFRQKAPGEWPSVFSEMAKALLGYLPH